MLPGDVVLSINGTDVALLAGIAPRRRGIEVLREGRVLRLMFRF